MGIYFPLRSALSFRNRKSRDIKMAEVFDRQYTHISCLFPEILTIIFTYLDVKDKGRVSQVCVAWRDAAYNRRVWRGVTAKLHLKRANPSLFQSLVKRGVRNIQVLSLRRTLRDVITKVQNIESLNLSGCFSVNDVSITHALTCEFPTLTVLNLSLCKLITDRSLEKIAQYLKNLEVLELGGCSNVTNIGMILISMGLKRLKVLNLRSCRHISDSGIGHLCGLYTKNQLSDSELSESPGNFELEHLVLQDCQKLTDKSLEYVSSGLLQLKSVNLSFCGNVTDSGIKYLSKMPCLKDLNLRSCDNVTNTGLGYLLDGGSRLEALDVSFCENVGDQGLHFVSHGMFSLRSLSLSACNISDEGLIKVVSALHDITTLNIGQCNKITDKSLGEISQNLKNLKCIDLYGCTRITTVGLEKIMQLPCLHTLNLGLWHKQNN